MATSKYIERPRSVVRRKDRQLTDEDWQIRMLEQSPVGHLAISWNGEPFIHSNIFWYHRNNIYLHQARVGRMRAIADLGPTQAVFTVSEMGRILPNYTPLEFSVEYASVLAYGELTIVEDLAEMRYALEGLMEKYAPQLEPGKDYDPMPDSDIRQTTVHKIAISELVGKHNVKPDDYVPDKVAPYKMQAFSFIDEERESGRVTIQPKELA